MRDAWYWLSCRFWHRYNTVVCQSLPPTWCDRDHLLLYAAFQILEDFIEKEQPWEFNTNVYATYVKDCGEEHARKRETDWHTIRQLYAWWKVRKSQEIDLDLPAYDEDTQRLRELVNIRENLWT